MAIAVPLFVGQLTKAEESVRKANIRTVRGEATIYLLSIATPDGIKDSTTSKDIIFDDNGNFQDYIKVSTTVDATGKIGKLVFESGGAAGDTDTCEKNTSGGYDVTVTIDTTDTITGEAAKGE